ncbi:hypothetical protein CRG98_018296 [Punica granatum]|uniref:Reverse transcriptase domain-containing protein n=1 Tax=Punica granatum TaxID=22663 RepID=A0A2I0JYD6_PUNGR|nr:hypothetical protein CRG98_018296 [Punica granatum]
MESRFYMNSLCENEYQGNIRENQLKFRAVTKGKVLLRYNYIPGTGLGARGQGINCPIEIIEARKGNLLHHLAAHYGRLNRGIPVPPLSHFFPRPPHIIGGALDGPFSDSDNAPAAMPAVLHSNPNLRHVDSNPFKERLGEPRPVYFGEGLVEDGQVPEIEESLSHLEDHQLTSVEPTEEINVGTEEEPRTLKIRTGLDAQRARMIDFLREYQEVFAWSYADMLGLDPSIVKHFLPFDTEKFLPKRQQLRRQRASLLLRIKEEVVKQINAGFLKVCNYSEWVANIIPVEKKDRRVQVCVDCRDLNKASPKDNFPLPHIDVLVDNMARRAQFAFMDGFSGCNQIRMTEEDKIKTTFTTMWGTFCYRVMPFGLKNAGATYQRAMVTLFYDMMHKEVEMYFDGAVNSAGSGVGAVLISSNRRHYPIAAKVDFSCTNNVAEYEACILDLQAAIDFKNQFADALATLASMASITKGNIIEPLEIEVAKGPAYYDAIEATDAKPWYEDIKNFLQTGQYPPFVDRHDRKTLRRLAVHYFLSGETLYRRSFDATLLRCIDIHEAQRLMEEVHG